MSDEILDAVSRHDGQYEGGNFSDEWEDDVAYDARPATAEKGDSVSWEPTGPDACEAH